MALPAIKIISSKHWDVDGDYWLYYPLCARCRTSEDPEGEDWYDVDPHTGIFGRPWDRTLKLALDHLRYSHGV